PPLAPHAPRRQPPLRGGEDAAMNTKWPPTQRLGRRKGERETKMAGSRSRIIPYAVAVFIALAGLADATYLTVQSLTGETLVCGGSADCFRVLGSAYAKVAGIPVAAFGVLGYFGAFSLVTFAAFG